MAKNRFPNIEAERARHGMTQEELASKLGVTDATYRNWQNGRNVIPASKIILLSQLFGVSTDYLLSVG